jgi:hypothetical protein
MLHSPYCIDHQTQRRIPNAGVAIVNVFSQSRPIAPIGFTAGNREMIPLIQSEEFDGI